MTNKIENTPLRDTMGNTEEDIRKMSIEIYNSHKNQYYCSNCLSLATMSVNHTNCACGCGDYRWFGIPIKTAYEPIDYVGHEMEGMYNDQPDGNDIDVFFHDDGSVECDDDSEREHDGCDCYEDDDGDYHECDCCSGECDCGYTSDYQYVGEFVTRKIKYRNDKKEITQIIRDNFPDFTNDSCGGHLHISFKDERFYSLCMSKDYWVGLLTKMKLFAENCDPIDKNKLLHRIRGSHYCKAHFTPEKQIWEEGDRYTQINYCHNRYGTLEIRLLPMFEDKHTHIEAVKLVLDYTSDFIRMHLAYSQPERVVTQLGTAGKIKRKSHLEVYKKQSIGMKPEVVERKELEVLE